MHFVVNTVAEAIKERLIISNALWKLIELLFMLIRKSMRYRIINRFFGTVTVLGSINRRSRDAQRYHARHAVMDLKSMFLQVLNKAVYIQ